MFNRLKIQICRYKKENIGDYFLRSIYSSQGEKSLDLDTNEKSTEIDPKKMDDDMPVEMTNPYLRKKDVCILCKHGIKLDYKNPKLLSQFVSPYTGQLYDRHITRLCAKQQGNLQKEIQRSRAAGHMAVMIKSTEYLKDPQLFDPNNPIRPHKY